MKLPRDFLDACKKTGRDPKTVREPESYMRAWHRTGEAVRKRRLKRLLK